MLRLLTAVGVLVGLTGCELVAGIEDRSSGEAGCETVVDGLCPNLLARSDFEGWSSPSSSAPQWTALAGEGTLARSSDAHCGAYALEVQGEANAPSWQIFSDSVQLAKGGYRFEAWIKLVAGHGRSPRVALNVSPHPTIELQWTASGDWELMAGSLDYQGDGNSGPLLISADFLNDETQTVLLDDMRFVRTDCAQP